MAKCQTDVKSAVKPELPNLLLATTYALNKSNSKRICVGLEYNAGYYHEVIKLCSSGPAHKNVTLDRHSWEIIKDQFEPMMAYFQNSYSFYQEFGRPSKIFLSNHDLNFTSSYGTRSIAIDERPKQEHYDSEEENQSSSTQLPCKKRKKFSDPPGIVMQQTTFEGLRSQSGLVDLLLDALKERVGKVNRTVDYILEFLKNKLSTEEAGNAESILKDLKAFKQYYGIHNSEIESFIAERMVDDSDDYKNQCLKIVLSEIVAFGLPMVAKDLRDYMAVV